MKPDKPIKVGQNRTRNQFRLVCKGGPWDGQEVVFPGQDSSPMSLPIRVGQHAGRYNLNNGEWEAL